MPNQTHHMNRLDALFARCAHTDSTAEADTAATMARRYMASQGISESDYDWYVKLQFMWSETERDYVLNNFRTAQQRWEEMDRQPQEAPAPPAGKARVKGHYRRNRSGVQVWVNGYYRNRREATTKPKTETTTDGIVWVRGYYRTRNGQQQWVTPHYRRRGK